MRTTVTIDDDLLEAARAVASQRRVSLGRVLSELIRKGLQGGGGPESARDGLPVFKQRNNARPITLERVKRAEEDEL